MLNKLTSKVWSDKYLVLSSITLKIFADERQSNKAPTADMQITGDATVEEEEKSKEGFQFSVTTPYSAIKLAAKSEREREAWMKQINLVIIQNKKSMRGYFVKSGMLMGSKKFFILREDILTCHPDHNRTAKIEAMVNINRRTKVSNKDENKCSFTIEDGDLKESVYKFNIQFNKDFDEFSSWFEFLNAALAKSSAFHDAMTVAKTTRRKKREEAKESRRPQSHSQPQSRSQQHSHQRHSGSGTSGGARTPALAQATIQSDSDSVSISSLSSMSVVKPLPPPTSPPPESDSSPPLPPPPDGDDEESESSVSASLSPLPPPPSDSDSQSMGNSNASSATTTARLRLQNLAVKTAPAKARRGSYLDWFKETKEDSEAKGTGEGPPAAPSDPVNDAGTMPGAARAETAAKSSGRDKVDDARAQSQLPSSSASESSKSPLPPPKSPPPSTSPSPTLAIQNKPFSGATQGPAAVRPSGPVAMAEGGNRGDDDTFADDETDTFGDTEEKTETSFGDDDDGSLPSKDEHRPRAPSAGATALTSPSMTSGKGVGGQGGGNTSSSLPAPRQLLTIRDVDSECLQVRER